MFRKIVYACSFYCSRLFYTAAAGIVVLFVLAYLFPALLLLAQVLLLCLALLSLLDGILVYARKQPVTVQRECAERFSNGDDNKVHLVCTNHLPHPVSGYLVDELPFQFQYRDWKRPLALGARETRELVYTLRPLERGEYHFGVVNVFLYGPLRMLVRHIRTGEEKKVAVYPSYLQLRRYQLMAATGLLEQPGTRQLRKIGHSLEFEQIKEYVGGDDYRTVNWKATARKSNLMVNTFVDERSQQVICLVDKGRSMKMPFEGLSLLDYAINACLVLSHIVLTKQDKIGLLSFGTKTDQFVAPDKKPTQLPLLLEALYRQQTGFTDSDYEALYAHIRYRIKQRSLLVLFTNFESMYAMQRQLPYLKKIAGYHPLLVVFFENTELQQLQQSKAVSLEEVYNKVIAQKFSFEKRQIVKELQKQGIMTLLTPPQQLTARTINKYLEIKARQVL